MNPIGRKVLFHGCVFLAITSLSFGGWYVYQKQVFAGAMGIVSFGILLWLGDFVDLAPDERERRMRRKEARRGKNGNSDANERG